MTPWKIKLANLLGISNAQKNDAAPHRNQPDLSAKKKDNEFEQCPTCGILIKAERLQRHIKRHTLKKSKAKKTLKESNKLKANNLTLEAIHSAYNPAPNKNTKFTENKSSLLDKKQNSKVYSTGSSYRESQKCVHCGRPAIPGDSVCRQCSSD